MLPLRLLEKLLLREGLEKLLLRDELEKLLPREEDVMLEPRDVLTWLLATVVRLLLGTLPMLYPRELPEFSTLLEFELRLVLELLTSVLRVLPEYSMW